jgi:hypothetical protein
VAPFVGIVKSLAMCARKRTHLSLAAIGLVLALIDGANDRFVGPLSLLSASHVLALVHVAVGKFVLRATAAFAKGMRMRVVCMVHRQDCMQKTVIDG